MTPAAATAKDGKKTGKSGKMDYVSTLTESAARLAAAAPADRPALGAELLIAFGALRSELWLWDAATETGRLAHSHGRKLERVFDRSANGEGPIGHAAARKQPIENAATAKEVAAAGLHRVTVLPLLCSGQLTGLLAAYTKDQATDEQLRWWKLLADMLAVAVSDSLTLGEDAKTITQLSLLFEATRLLNSTLDVAELLELILKIASTEVKADRGTVFMVDRAQQELWSIVASGLDHQEIRIAFGSGVAGRVAQSGEVINVADAYSLEFFEPSFDQKFNYKTRSLLCLPIRHRTGEIVGVIQLLNRVTGGQFTHEDEEFLDKLSAHIAMALENARLHREMLEKQRLERDLLLARTIQRGLLPEQPPVVPGYDIAVANQMCYEVGGDYYDFLNLGPQTLLVVIADVEGKGVASSLIMSNLQATLRALVMHLHSLEVLSLSLNDMICQDTRQGKFLSIFMGLVDTRGNRLHYINCGHVPPLLINAETGAYKLLDQGGMVIGMFPDATYSRGVERLTKGDILVCCTDGILEAADRKEEEYGSQRLAACVAHNREKPAKNIVDTVLDEVTKFSQGGPNVDDKVLMVLKVTADATSQSGKIPAYPGGQPVIAPAR